jgi:hypothetical protein
MDREYEAEGTVEAAHYDRTTRYVVLRVAGDWWRDCNDSEHRVEIVAPDGARCRLCGAQDGALEAVDVELLTGEDGEPDDGGCFSEHHTEWRCSNRATCRQNRHALAAVYRQQAETDHLVGLEAGMNGRIGGGVYG